MNKKQIYKKVGSLLFSSAVAISLVGMLYVNNELQQENNNQVTTIGGLEENLKAKEEVASRLQKELDEQATVVDGLNSTITDLEAQIVDLEANAVKLEAEIANFKQPYQGDQETSTALGTSLGEYRISFYDTSFGSIEKDVSVVEPITASGLNIRGKNIYDRLIACPPDIPFNTKLYLEFLDMPQLSGVYTCVDRGGAIQGNKIDVFYEDYNMEGTVWDLGIKYANVYLVE